MQQTNVPADMADDPTGRPLTDRELAQLIRARSGELADESTSREELLVELLQLVVRETPNAELRVDTIGTRGRVSFGRDRAGEHGTALFVPDPVVDTDELEETLEEARSEA